MSFVPVVWPPVVALMMVARVRFCGIVLTVKVAIIAPLLMVSVEGLTVATDGTLLTILIVIVAGAVHSSVAVPLMVCAPVTVVADKPTVRTRIGRTARPCEAVAPPDMPVIAPLVMVGV